ncbi:ribonuclease III [Inhella gelatinilytica]|uniref:Ribonuclease 3 n=1 Tax=Inhella gelatinilytica TaxID=2795030 RepID=A0A931NE44_9BURK|nr:ribonuclease III [Inhella gelatinilytica]MBH9553294.1 ribonuclease III [Inhella gelatinilytica]
MRELQAALGYSFRDVGLLQRALTHRSFSAQHNERLEFLGDAVLGLAITQHLYASRQQMDEGALSRMRAHLVREESLQTVARALNLPQHLRVSEGEARGGGAQRPAILADALEAVIGAVHLDGGFDAAQALVLRLFGPALLEDASATRWAKDAKTALQEWLQARKHPIPAYRIVSAQGKSHQQVFEVECAISVLSLQSRGKGTSRRAAEQQAAQALLNQLQGQTPSQSKDTP